MNRPNNTVNSSIINSLESSNLNIPSVIVSPTDWVRTNSRINNDSLSTLENEWHERLYFKNFTISNLCGLENKLEEALQKNITNETLKAQLATLLMQNLPNLKRLNKAQKLLDEIKDPNILNTFSCIKLLIKEMLKVQEPKSSIVRVNWGVFNRCPLTCRGCYNIFNEKVLSLNDCKKIIDKLKVAQVKELIISGGDPLLWSSIVEFCNYAYNSGLRIGIDTVSYNLNIQIANKLKRKIAYIGIPLDGYNQNIIEKFRLGKKNLLKVVLENLEMLSELKIPVRINTTVHKENINSLNELALIIKKYPIIQSWSLYQWWPLRAKDKLKNKMYLKEKEFEHNINILKNKHNKLNIFGRSIKNRSRNTFFISSNGEVYTFGHNAMISSIIIGDIKKQSVKDILKSPAICKMSQKFYSIKRFYSQTNFDTVLK